MKIIKIISCLVLVALITFSIAGCNKNENGNTSSVSSIVSGESSSDVESVSENISDINTDDNVPTPTAEFTTNAQTVADSFFGKDMGNMSIEYKNNELIDGKECFVFGVTDGADETGSVAIDTSDINQVFVCNANDEFYAYKVSVAELPESEAKNADGDRMILNVVDNHICIYDVDENEGVLAQIIMIDSDDGIEYTNNRVSAVNFNFDDYTDIAVSKGEKTSELSNSYSDYYLYDGTVNKFVKNEELSAIANIGVDGGDGTLFSYTYISENENEKITYVWSSGKLVPIKKTTQSYNKDEELFYITEYEYNESLEEIEVSRESYTKQELEALNS